MSSFALFITSLLLVNLCLLIATLLSKNGIVTSYTSRKIVHISLGTCQLLLWGYYPDEPSARVWGSMCCLLYLFVFLVFGLGLVQGKMADFLIATVCRHGDCHEMLYGPLNYCITMTFLSLVFWKNNPASVIGCSLMLWGDGLAEVIGKKFGKTEIKNCWGKTKTLEGAIAVWIFGALGAMGMCYVIFGNAYVVMSIILGAVGAIVEFISYPNYDNVFIPLSAVVFGYLF
ncbi:hypothetical protein EIN_284420 [Entamoeba invadens IP1]|uniref:Phosphatidate cytidylyltransferase n=1 Tax=Entamoeba invadens IP1 TaxID=370355 RepID=L7FJT2_ENTIV|nr:hypothetical protein EIN_284420 [Entamoeba invadens IP1]ELP84866.1 hypothetical protein EIN_284420 [Entamoeba invadens IP1]|eukprot:XP_004184212.1 hypothetical protein EIN_284420 [Entamoeba invadens IP1]